ncbi:MAG TPA: monofunctional biosynthetic peptidoglycan transglycosylase [Burkholderiales bacterium]|jgi:monofunctional biosynthetic peptidoglycan transglycosylase|nr:monofunctional biosynthetic peptidoglycan transglycosylase [Burkholderiales bacterium]
MAARGSVRSRSGGGGAGRPAGGLGRRIWRSFLWLFLLLTMTVLLYEGSVYARVWWWNEHNPTVSSIMEQRRDILREKDPGANITQTWVPYARISGNLKAAVIAAEDSGFVDHDGFDWDGIEKAFEKNRKKGKIVAGGSTITQQLAKNLFLSGERSYIRKGQEAAITWMLEDRMQKDRILEIYLNVVEWGNGIFGAEAAARHYFGIPAAQLSREQSAKLAAMLPNPRFYDRNRYAPYLMRRTGLILMRMNQVETP